MKEQATLATGSGQDRPVILVIDDDATMRSLLKSALHNLGYAAQLADGGAQALRALERTRPDLILLDVRLGAEDGVALIRQLRTSPEHMSVPVLLMSGDPRREMLVRGLSAGATDFLTKPFRLDVLRSKLEKALRRVGALCD